MFSFNQLSRMPTQKGGGSVGQSLQYMDVGAKEQTASAGGDLLAREGQIVRPAIPVLRGGTQKQKKGGFIPSIMTGVVNNGVYLAPLVGITAKRLMNDMQVGTRKHRGKKGKTMKHRGGAKKDQWIKNQTAARAVLAEPSMVERFGKPSAVNVNKFAVARRKGPKAAEDFLEEYQVRKLMSKTKKVGKGKKKAAAPALAFSESRKVVKRVPKVAKAPAVPKVGKAAWKTLINQAHNRLRREEGRGTRANAMKFAALLKKGENTTAFLTGLRAKPAAKAKTAKASRKASPPAQTVNTDPELVALMARQAAEEAAAAAASKKATSKKTTAKKATAAASAAPVGEAAGRKVTPPYFRELREARTFLSQYGVPRGPNMSEYVKLKRKGESTAVIVNRVQSRAGPGTAAAAKAAASATTLLKEKMKAKTTAFVPKGKLSAVQEESERANTAAASRAAAGEAAAEAAAGRKVTPPYFRELREARTTLSQYGVPRGPNMSEFVKLQRKGESTAGVVNRVRSRAATHATTAKAKPKKAGNNNMQGYEEDFEPANE